MTTHINSVAKEAALDPASLFNSSLSDPKQETRDTGLILTKEQIKYLKKYEIAGLALPTELKDVIARLGYEKGAGRGLEATDFQKTFQLIHNHASLWNPLRTDLLSTGDKLLAFAGTIQVYGKDMADVFNDIDALRTVEEHNIQTLDDVRRLKLELGDKFPGIELSPKNETDREDISYYLDEILKRVKQRESEANAIKVRLDAFGRELAINVAPAIALKLSTIDNNTLGNEIKPLQEKIDNRAKDIEEKNKEYKQLVKEAIGGIGAGLILVIYVSVQAEKIRKERNALNKLQEADIALMAQKNLILASLDKLRLDFQNLDLVVVDADIATKNLITVWNKLGTFIAESSIAVDTIDDGLSWRRFKTTFNLVIEPWKTIEQDAYALLQVFAQADIEFREEYGDQK